MMGYVGAESVGWYGTVPDMNFILDDVQCRGDEIDIFSCPRIENHNCGVTVFKQELLFSETPVLNILETL